MPRVLLSTWRRQGRTFGPVLRDMYGAEVQYVHAVQRAGMDVFLAPQPLAGTDAGAMVDGFDGLVLIGGEDLAADVSGVEPEHVGLNAVASRDRWEIALLEAALSVDVPVLAVCRGMQLLNVARGGTLLGDIAGTSPVHPPVPPELEQALGYRHRVEFRRGSRLHGIYGVRAKDTNSLHHQAIDRLGEGLEVVGTAADGVVEAVELRAATWCVGVQWHPELLPQDALEANLFAAFAHACADQSGVRAQRATRQTDEAIF